jgi:hypothetical protein
LNYAFVRFKSGSTVGYCKEILPFPPRTLFSGLSTWYFWRFGYAFAGGESLASKAF